MGSRTSVIPLHQDQSPTVDVLCMQLGTSYFIIHTDDGKLKGKRKAGREETKKWGKSSHQSSDSPPTLQKWLLCNPGFPQLCPNYCQRLQIPVVWMATLTCHTQSFSGRKPNSLHFLSNALYLCEVFCFPKCLSTRSRICCCWDLVPHSNSPGRDEIPGGILEEGVRI